eukprot:1782293-Prymnesium_polylepis.2
MARWVAFKTCGVGVWRARTRAAVGAQKVGRGRIARAHARGGGRTEGEDGEDEPEVEADGAEHLPYKERWGVGARASMSGSTCHIREVEVMARGAPAR